jgi:benzoylformate decarboxylase
VWPRPAAFRSPTPFHADPKGALPELIEAVRRHAGKNGHPQAAKRLEAARNAHQRANADLVDRAQREAGQLPMSPLTLVHEVARSVPRDVTIVDESISSGAGIRNLMPCADAKSFFGLRGGGIGWGLPAAIGVKLALPQRPVVALVGDGSAMYTNQALWTAARESVAVVYVILNNASYRILKQRTHGLKGFSFEDDHYVAMDLDRPLIDYVGLARSLGVPGERVEKPAEVAGAMERALASGGPYLIDVKLDATFK